MTAGADGSTMDNRSDSRIESIINTLKDQSYQPSPARREYITKKNSKKKRPLGIPSGDDKLVQEIVRMLLESIFEPNFSKRSHDFRPKRSCQTALKHIQDTFTVTHWFVEGDIEACFDSFDHHIIVDLLKRRTDDNKLIALMWKFLKAGYMEQWQYHKTYDGVPRGSGISPILSNIYLSEPDTFMEEYKADFDVGSSSKRQRSREYRNAIDRAYIYKKRGAELWENLTDEQRKERAKELRTRQAEIRKLPAAIPNDEKHKAVQYVRYADDFLIGLIGSREEAQTVKDDIKQFMAEKLKLKMSDEKTRITHTGDRIKVFGI